MLNGSIVPTTFPCEKKINYFCKIQKRFPCLKGILPNSMEKYLGVPEVFLFTFPSHLQKVKFYTEILNQKVGL